MPRIAKALDTLRSQVNGMAPKRSRNSDGWIGDAKHRARKSDHNPNPKGVVQALDLTHDPKGGFNSYAFAELLRTRRDPRIKYVISNGRIFAGVAGPKPWQWRTHKGARHDQHVHISVEDLASLYDDASPWKVAPEKVKVPPPPDIEPVEDQPEPDDTKPHAAEPGTPKTGISEGATVAGGAGITGVAYSAWESVSTAPESILQVIIAAMSKPQFWIFAVVIAAGVYVWWRRRNMKKAT